MSDNWVDGTYESGADEPGATPPGGPGNAGSGGDSGAGDDSAQPAEGETGIGLGMGEATTFEPEEDEPAGS